VRATILAQNYYPIKFHHSTELITGKTGLLLLDQFWNRFNLNVLIDNIFGKPGSNRGLKASKYVRTLVELIIDGGSHQEDVRKLEADAGYKKLIGIKSYPTSDAIGDWLRRQGELGGEKKMWQVISQLLKMNKDKDLVLDVDATLIESDKGDGEKSYKGIVGYHPLLGMTVENGLCVGSRFRYGNEYAGADLLGFIKECNRNVGNRVKIVRSDSAGYNHEIINYCDDEGIYFIITADHDKAVMETINNIENSQWEWGKNEDGSKAEWQVAETNHTMNETKRAHRLVVKRTKIKGQLKLFNGNEYNYWSQLTSLPDEIYSTNGVPLFQHGRGEMERLIGEFKNHFTMEHMPCGQMRANSVYFTIGVLAYNIIQLIKEISLDKEWLKRSIRSIRYNIIHLPSKIISSSRYLVSKIVCAKELYECFVYAYNKLRYAPFAPT
jgi:hypothetical protein